MPGLRTVLALAYPWVREWMSLRTIIPKKGQHDCVTAETFVQPNIFEGDPLSLFRNFRVLQWLSTFPPGSACDP